jgi:membrane protein YdbS with pleckstrin-like domain
VKRRLLRVLRLAERPDPPPGSGDTLVVFRASRRLFQLHAAGWVLRQGLALAGILFSFALLAALEAGGQPGGWLLETLKQAVPPEGQEIQRRLLEWNSRVSGLVRAFEWIALGFFAVNLGVSWLLLRLDWEARWYMVSEESLRIREGLFRTHERTMTVANIQNLRIRRGPVQKLLGIADLEVQTAGGGAASGGAHRLDASKQDDLHLGRFRGIDDAEGLRDRIQASMLRHRGSGLGDPDERHDEAPSPIPAVSPSPAVNLSPAVNPSPAVSPGSAGGALLAACEELVREARGLRAAAERRGAA